MPFITIFTAPKPFTNPHIATIQRNAIRSWLQLGQDVEALLMGEEEGVAHAAGELGARFIPAVERNAYGTPLVSSLFALARQAGNSALLAYINADILLLPDFLQSARQIAGCLEHFLVIGQRWDLAVKEELDFSPGWDERLRQRYCAEGRRHPRRGSDYFIFPRQCFVDVPALAVGRAGWDNWMIYEARRRGWATVDASQAIQIVHQDHDYSHLPHNQPHYRLPESAENTRLAGGRRAIFTLLDADCRLENGQIRRPALTWEKLRREVEIFPLVRLRSKFLGQVFYAIFHPVKAYGELRAWLCKGLHLDN